MYRVPLVVFVFAILYRFIGLLCFGGAFHIQQDYRDGSGTYDGCAYAV